MRAFLLGLALLAPLPAFAHKVIFDVYPSGNVIEGELGFSDGTMAAGAQVGVFDMSGEKIDEITTDADGLLRYVPKAPGALEFRVDLSAGHVGDVTLPAEDVARVLGIGADMAELAQQKASAAPAVAASLTLDEKLAIAEAVRNEVLPLRREIAAYKEHNSLQSILGGIGYIIGLFGLGFYFAARRKLAR